MDVYKFLSLLYKIYAEQENIQIEYKVDDYFFSTESFK